MNVTRSDLEKITYERILVTPAWAACQLDNHNTSNRRKKPAGIRQLRSDIENGDWTITADHIAFDVNGVLQNGQNRLSAIVGSGRSVWAIVMRGLPAQSFNVTDTGSKRTLADVLGVMGYKHPKDLAALLPAIFVWNKSGKAIGSGGTRHLLTNSAALKMLDELDNDVLYECIRQGNRVYRIAAGSPTAWALAFWIFSSIDQDDAEGFADRMVDVQSGSHFGLLRQRFLDDRNAADGVLGYRKDLALALIIKVWNAYRTGDTVKLLRYRAGGANPEQYPKRV